MIALTGKKYVEKLVQMSDSLICHFSLEMNNEMMVFPEDEMGNGVFSHKNLFEVCFLEQFLKLRYDWK